MNFIEISGENLKSACTISKILGMHEITVKTNDRNEIGKRYKEKNCIKCIFFFAYELLRYILYFQINFSHLIFFGASLIHIFA